MPFNYWELELTPINSHRKFPTLKIPRILQPDMLVFTQWNNHSPAHTHTLCVYFLSQWGHQCSHDSSWTKRNKRGGLHSFYPGEEIILDLHFSEHPLLCHMLCYLSKNDPAFISFCGKKNKKNCTWPQILSLNVIEIFRLLIFWNSNKDKTRDL